MEKFKSVSWAILEPCNMKCKFCFATFNDIKGIENLNAMGYDDGCRLIDELAKFGITKLTFYGGEPTLVKHLGLWIDYAKQVELTTMLVTNGTQITEKYIVENLQSLDWIVLSIDSLSDETNMRIGRSTRQGVLSANYYLQLVELFKKHKKRLKINTVVCAPNKYEDMTNFIYWAEPERWKLLQAYKVKGQNDGLIEEMEVTEKDFWKYIERHNIVQSYGIEIVPESVSMLDNSYLMIDPKGRFFQSVGGHHYSEPITKVGIENAYEQISKDVEKYVSRKGIYAWN
jgi:radical S-adenosyl methionine domain-containing protein 2